jgi:UDP:flavonoid glycosyltransferase YjiC (YdhE family)
VQKDPTLCLGIVGSAKLTAEILAEGIEAVTTDQSIIAAAQTMNVQVQSEDGLANAINFIDKMAMSFKYPWPTHK